MNLLTGGAALRARIARAWSRLTWAVYYWWHTTRAHRRRMARFYVAVFARAKEVCPDGAAYCPWHDLPLASCWSQHEEDDECAS